MDKESLFDIWAPPQSHWSSWAKPVLFAQLSKWDRLPEGTLALVEAPWAPPAHDRAALVLDLPQDLAVRLSPDLARRGYRPVPLYNCSRGPSPVLTVTPIIDGLYLGAQLIEASSVPPDAPPAFLLDSDRSEYYPVPGMYDNRWVVLPQDFPSAACLQRHDIRSIWLVQKEDHHPKRDLSHVLRRWSDAGLPLMELATAGNSSPAPLQVRRPSWYRSLWYTLTALKGFRRNNVGGFGAKVPVPPESGGYGGGFG